ncbi:MAG: hypothetical protein FJX57_10135 [Alphaproteobacteria bacterium]|nr:hypothetical protein [Alphaproteobacteria bacterium]
MRIWELPAGRGDLLERARAAAGSAAEAFLREDGQGAFLLCETGTAPAGVIDKRVEILFAGGRSGLSAGPWVFCVGLWVPEEYAVEFRAWYRHEHVPILLECPQWNGFRFVEQEAGRGRQYYALHWLAERAALDSEYRKISRATPWFRRFARHDWFDGAFVRVLGRRAA